MTAQSFRGAPVRDRRLPGILASPPPASGPKLAPPEELSPRTAGTCRERVRGALGHLPRSPVGMGCVSALVASSGNGVSVSAQVSLEDN